MMKQKREREEDERLENEALLREKDKKRKVEVRRSEGSERSNLRNAMSEANHRSCWDKTCYIHPLSLCNE